MLKKDLFDYQVEGVQFMYDNKKCLNLDDCGLGKTAQALGLIDKLNSERLHKVILVVKSENILQWKDEIKDFTNLKITYVTGNKKQREAKYRDFIANKTAILLINYNKIIYDFKVIQEVKAAVDTIIFDEAFALKSPDSEIHLNFESLTASFARIVMLTATPIGATLFDFYNIMRVMHINLPSEEDFIEQYVECEDTFAKMGYRYYRKQRMLRRSKNVEDFKEEYSRYFIRRENKGKYDFNLNIIKHGLNMSDEQLLLCQDLQSSFINQGPDDAQIPVVRVYSQFAQLADAPVLVKDTLTSFSPKVEKLLKILEESDEQFVVYAKYLAFHDIVGKALEEHGISFLSISGKVSVAGKDKVKKQFAKGEARVLLITDAGKVGLNLQNARNLILLDVPSSASDCFQFIGRVYRTGQTMDVNVYFLYMLNSLEEDKLASMIERQQDIDTLLDQNKAEYFTGLPSRSLIKSFIKRDYSLRIS